MKANEIKTPSFKDMTARIIAELRTITSIADDDAEVIEAILQGELEEECRMLDSYYWEEHYNNYCNEISSVRTGAYEAGYGEGYDDGYAKSHYAV